MELFEDQLRRRGTDLNSDASDIVRMKERPMRATGMGFAGLGSDFGGASQSKKSLAASNRSRQNSRRTAEQSAVSTDSNPETSPDELDSFRPSRDSLCHKSPGQMAHRSSRRQKSVTDSEACNADGVIMQGEFHEYHPNYKPQNRIPTFKKKTANSSGAASQSSQDSASSTKATLNYADIRSSLPRPRRVDSPELSRAAAFRALVGSQGRNPPLNELYPNRGRSPSPIDVDPDTEPEQRTPRPSASQRPKPRPAYRKARASTSSRNAQNVTVVGPGHDEAGKYAMRPVRRRKGSSASSEGEDENSSAQKRSEKAKAKGKAKEKQSTNPIEQLSPLSYHAQDDSDARASRSGGKARAAVRGAKKKQLVDHSSLRPLLPQTSKRGARRQKSDDFPVDPVSPRLSQKPRTTTKALQPGEFPFLSPLSTPPNMGSSQSQGRKAKTLSQRSRLHKRTVMSSAESSADDEMDEDEALQPFPMQTQLLESIGRSPPKRSDGKNSDLEEGEARRTRKKRRADVNPDEILADILRADEGSELDEDDMVLLGREVDPHTLCPWCDERLPAALSPHLRYLITMARDVSVRNPRPTNPLGLRAPVGMFVSVCQRHRFESHQVPKAQAHGWPAHIDWERVPLRLKALESKLQDIIDDVDEDFLPGAQRTDGIECDDGVKLWADRPRKRSVFWQDVIKSVRTSGSRKAAGVAGQLANFSKTQPGYYGELGYMIIHQTMYDMFPPSSFTPDSTLPLTPTDFIQLILIPEAAVYLIMEDMGQLRDEAIVTLRDSAEYGVAMFPDDQTESANGVDQGERIIMKRAKARRRELEVEDRLEEKRLASSQDAESHIVRPKPRQKIKHILGPESEMSDLEVVTPKPKPATKGKGKARSNTSRGPTDSEASACPSKSCNVEKPDDGRRVTRSQSRARSSKTDSDIEMVVSEHGPSPNKVLCKPKSRRKRASGVATEEPTDHIEVGRDGRHEFHPSSSPETIVEMCWEDGDVLTRQGGPAVDEDRTPMSNKMSRPTFGASKEASIFPLQRARERTKRTDDGWSHIMRSHPGGISEDEHPAYDSPGGSRPAVPYYSMPPQRTEDHKWLLSDNDE